MHTLDLQARIFVQYPIASASETCVLVLPPTTNELKNLVVSYQVPNVIKSRERAFTISMNSSMVWKSTSLVPL